MSAFLAQHSNDYPALALCRFPCCAHGRHRLWWNSATIHFRCLCMDDSIKTLSVWWCADGTMFPCTLVEQLKKTLHSIIHGNHIKIDFCSVLFMSTSVDVIWVERESDEWKQLRALVKYTWIQNSVIKTWGKEEFLLWIPDKYLQKIFEKYAKHSSIYLHSIL